MACADCHRDNCRKEFWRKRVELARDGKYSADLEALERGFYAAKVSCFIRAGQRAQTLR